MPPKYRNVVEGAEWDAARRRIDPDAKRFDEWFRWTQYNISVAPRVNTTPFISDNYRIMTINEPGVAELWIYFRIELDDDTCTLLWIQSKGGNIAFRVG